MATVQVQAARIPDRDQLLELLDAQGVEAEPRGELGLQAQFADDERPLGTVAQAVTQVCAQFVPVEHDGVIYVRPPVS